MSRKKSKLHVVSGGRAAASGPDKNPRMGASAAGPSVNESASTALPQVSGRWLLKALAGALAAAVLCVWGVLCLLFWQGSWQLLYHPAPAITRTPASVGLAFDNVGFDTNPSGVSRLSGWWIPAVPDSRYTVLYLHDRDGNLSNTVDQLAQLHAAGINVFAFDYRGYGQSQFVHPSEAHWLEDAGSAYNYLTGTRHIDSHFLVLDGRGLGADLALEVAATSHGSAAIGLAGVVADSPLEDASGIFLNDARASLVPAHSLVRDRWDLASAAEALRIPSLWFLPFPAQPKTGTPAQNPPVFEKVTAPKMFVWLPPGQATTVSFSAEFSRWLDSLNVHAAEPATPASAAPAPAAAPAQPSRPARHKAHHRHAPR
jgi:hypothetical protein